MKIREATTDDLPACVELNNQCLLDPHTDPREGFLLDELTLPALTKLAKDGVLRVAAIDNRLIAFILAFKRGGEFFKDLQLLLKNVQWIDSTVSDESEIFYIYKEAVDQAFRRRGICWSLYEHLFKEFPGYSFVLATVEKPVPNNASLAFREKHNFRRVGTFNAAEFQGIKNYQSGIYFRVGV